MAFFFKKCYYCHVMLITKNITTWSGFNSFIVKL